MVQEILDEIGEFRWGDPTSEQLLQVGGEIVERQEEVILPSKVKYIGEWSQSGKRHGRGT